MSILSAFKEGNAKDDPWSMRRILAAGCGVIFWVIDILLTMRVSEITVFWVPLILVGFPFVGMLAFMFLTTWESIQALIKAWKGQSNAEDA
jgi:hypothetical protein